MQGDNAERVADRDVLEAALRLARETLERDHRLLDLHLVEIDRDLRLQIASLAALLAVLGLLVSLRFLPDLISILALTVGGLANVVSVLILVTTKVGGLLRGDIAAGPDLHHLVQGCRDPEWDLGGLLFSELVMCPEYGDANQDQIHRLATRRRSAVALWTSGVALYALGYVYVVLGLMLGLASHG